MHGIQDQLKGKLVVSCQAAPGDPLEEVEVIRRIARTAVGAGAAGLRVVWGGYAGSFVRTRKPHACGRGNDSLG